MAVLPLEVQVVAGTGADTLALTEQSVRMFGLLTADDAGSLRQDDGTFSLHLIGFHGIIPRP
jgi:hypothetical protein